ncbi:MAG: hypothetical protein FJ011_19410 [Chloroflexi bacterium]|nr:hypothetical protein [Chloroflexota bacterium]
MTPMRLSICCFLIVLAALALARPAAGQTTEIRLRIGVVADGIVRLTPADLTTAGIDPATVDPRRFAMTSLGQPVAIRVTGEADGRFDPGDYVEFFGQRFRGPEMEQKYTDERVYWLEAAAAPGPRIPDVDATPAGDLDPPANFPATVRAEQSLLWYTLHSLNLDTQDTWYWARLTPIGAGAGVTRTFPFTVPHPANGYTVTLRVEEVGRASQNTINPDHRTAIGLNGTFLLDETWDGHTRYVFTATAQSSLLVSGVNTVTVAALNPAGINADDVYVNFWELDYRRLFRAWEGQLDFRVEISGAHEYSTAGWPSVQVAIWDVTDLASPRRLIGAASGGGGGGYTVRFRADAGVGTRFWLQAQEAPGRPATVRLRPSTGLRQPVEGADAVLVTADYLRPAAERLAEWHRSRGRRALVADIQDVFDEFNAGVYHPRAITAMLLWARDHWPGPAPAYLTLVGDGHWNFKGFNPALYPPQPNPIPPFLAWVDPWQGEVPADPLYGDLDGDGAPDVAVGRLAVNTLSEAQTVVGKIVAYDEGVRMEPWQRRALFVADNADSAGDFPALSDQAIRAYLPGDLTAVRAYLPAGATSAQIVATRNAISEAINSGVWLVQYAGHGAPERWTNEGVWRLADIASLRNAGRTPVVMTFNCLDGYFAHPDPARFSVAETMQRLPGGGSVAAISPSGLGVTYDQMQFRTLLMDTLFSQSPDGLRQPTRELGRALLLTAQRFHAQYGSHYLIPTMMLFGDPAMRLPRNMPTYRLPLLMKGSQP